MNHFNFFENISKEKETVNYAMVCAVLFICAAVVIGFIFASAEIRLRAVHNDLNYLKSVENDPQFNSQKTLEKELDQNLTRLENYYLFLGSVEWLDTNGSTVDDILIKKIAENFPEGTKIIKIDVSRRDVTINGVAENPDAMIKVQKNLSADKMFTDVFVNTAKQDGHTQDNGDSAVTFTCRFRISGEGNGN